MTMTKNISSIILTKELYEETMTAIVNQRQHDYECARALNKIYKEKHLLYNNSIILKLIHDLVSLSVEECPRNDKGDFILNEKSKLTFDKKLFIKVLSSLERQEKYDSECSKYFSVLFPDSYVGLYDNSRVVNQILKLLKIAFDDNHRDSWIDYFIYELEYGKKYKQGCATNKDGSFIDLSNSDTLFDFLILQSE